MHIGSARDHVAASARRLLAGELDRLIADSTRQLLALEEPYRMIGEKSLGDEMRKNLTVTLLRVSGDPIPDELIASAHATGRLRAAQGIDLPAVLRSFRIDLRVLWTAFLADSGAHGLGGDPEYTTELLRVWEAIEANIGEVTAGYQAEAARRAQHDSEMKSGAFQRLLTVGALRSGAAVAQQLEVLGFDPASPLVCVVSDLQESDAPALAELQARLAQREIAHYFGWQQRDLVGFLQPRPDRTPTVERLLDELAAFRTAYVEVTEPTRLLDAVRNARLLTAASHAPGLCSLRDHWIDALAQAEPTLVTALVEDLFAPFRELSDYVREELTRVIEGFFSTNGTITEVARVTYRHRNTIRNRLAQVEELTGLSMSVPRDAALLAIALPIWRRECAALASTPSAQAAAAAR